MNKQELQNTTLDPQAVTWFEGRGIEIDTLTYAGIVTSPSGSPDVVHVAFPRYDSDGEVLKTRNLTIANGTAYPPSTMQGTDSFYNGQGLDLAIEEEQPLVICQSEMDCLSLIESGYAWTIAYIDGDDLLWENRDKLKTAPHIILAGYDNEVGKEFNDIISRQLGIENCSFLVYPDECRTINDILLKYDDQTVTETITSARSYPVVGLYRPDEFPPIPADLKKVYETTLGHNHNNYLKIMLGKFMTVTGIPGMGKSTWTDNLVMNLAKAHRWNVCVCSGEIDNEEYQEESLERYMGKPLHKATKGERASAEDFYQNHYTFITNNTMNDELELTLEKLIELAKIAIVRDGAKILLIDPFNELDHQRNNGESETEYTGRFIRKLKQVAKQYKILVIIVAHPNKPAKGETGPPSLYSISGSSHWANKSDYGIIIHREDMQGTRSTIITAKIKRHGAMGYVGEWEVDYDTETRQFNE